LWGGVRDFRGKKLLQKSSSETASNGSSNGTTEKKGLVGKKRKKVKRTGGKGLLVQDCGGGRGYGGPDTWLPLCKERGPGRAEVLKGGKHLKKRENAKSRNEGVGKREIFPRETLKA